MLSDTVRSVRPWGWKLQGVNEYYKVRVWLGISQVAVVGCGCGQPLRF